MNDKEIVDLYWQRDENAITESDNKYGARLTALSRNILGTDEDAQECVWDTYHRAWGSMPTDRPDYLGAYLSRIARNLSITRYRKMKAQKRSAGVDLIYDELSECLFDVGADVFARMMEGELSRTIDGFLSGLDREKRIVFVRRYFFSEPIKDIARDLNMSESKVKSMLHRMRESLARLLKEKG